MEIAFVLSYVVFLIVSFIRYKITIKLAQVAIATTLLLVCAIQDYKKKKITIGIVIVVYIISAILTGLAFGVNVLIKQFLFSVSTFAILFVARYLTKKGIGEGDIFVLATLVFCIGPALSFAVFSIASIMIIIRFLFKGKKENKEIDEPLVPYLFVSAIPLLLLL